MFRRVLIANRGEIAVRIIRTCREMNIETVAIYSTADKESLHVKLATKAVCVGSPKAADSYLHMKNILTAAVETGCDAIHPGFGFLSENSDFARLCQESGIIFIGPKADVIDALGNKASEDEFETVEQLSKLTNTTPPAPIKALRGKKVRFNNICEPENMDDAVLGYLNIK